MLKKIMGLAVAIVLLAGCAAKHDLPEEQNFKPYIANQQENFSDTYAALTYPAGTSTKEIAQRWAQAKIIKGVRNGGGVPDVIVGPQFYSLSWAQQRGIAQTVSQMYNASHYMLRDGTTNRVVGVYTPMGLQLN